MSERNKTGILNLNVKKIYQLALSIECSSKIDVGEFIFYHTINLSANLKRQFTKIGYSYHQIF